MSQDTVPKHIGLILDGNRRWAKDNNRPKFEGHRQGFENIKTIGKAAVERGVKYLSVYVFSTENWKRSQDEVKYLMDLALDVAKNQVQELMDNNIRVRFLGSPEGVRQDILDAIKEAEEKSSKNDGGTLAICFNYGVQQEVTDAVRQAAESGEDMSEVSPEILAKYLYAPDIPPVDLLIRTSGEQRISNFMLWRAAYSELLFVDKHWPAFTVEDLDMAIEEFNRRSRRFGGN